MKSLNLFAVVTVLALAGGTGTAQAAGAERVLEEVVLTAKVPARPGIECVLVVAELPESLKTERAASAEPTAIVLALEPPRVDANAPARIEAARPTLSL